MSFEKFPSALVLTGPTGSGKSRLALTVAERLDAEIIAMDSMTLYRGMNIGTAKPSDADRRRVPHHLLDVLEPWESATVAWWLAQAEGCYQDITWRGKRALFVGGTPLYLKALLHGLFEGPSANAEVRERLTAIAAQDGGAALYQRLAQVDPTAASRLHPNDVRRVIRALEVWELTGQPISGHQSQWRRPTVPTDNRVLWLDLPRSQLYARINARVQEMIVSGLLDELRRLRAAPQPLSREASQALGYKELFAYLDGQGSLDEAITQIQTRSRQFAKRQLTWFRQMPECQAATEELTLSVWCDRILKGVSK
jgi:tRNA dimethylallyltransferase